ncbi:MAG: hypothetical protein IT361_14460 [Gemmatimonadaceae bacterium]|nr:hypothetical protein [Gemmatimonadaceae bacterium]
MSDATTIQFLGYAIDFSTPWLAVAWALGIGFALAVIPMGAAELVAFAAGALRPAGIIGPVVVSFTCGHVAGKLVWFWLGTQEARVRRPHVRRVIDDAKAITARHPAIGAAVLATSAVAGLPPFHLTTVAAGIARYPLVPFVAITFTGRLVRFGLIALIPGTFVFD